MKRYQYGTYEWNQALLIRSVKAKTFKEVAKQYDTSPTTVIHCFKQLIKALPTGVQLPRAIAIDEYKADTDADMYQLIIANTETHEPLDILPNGWQETIKQYNIYVHMVRK